MVHGLIKLNLLKLTIISAIGGGLVIGLAAAVACETMNKKKSKDVDEAEA